MMNKKKSTMMKRYQQSYETKDSGAGSKKGVMNWKKVEGDISFFSPVEGRNRINIIPYTIKTKNHPLVKRGEFEIGDKDYVMDIFVHRGVGPTEASVLCLKNTYGKPCPICEQMAVLNKQGKEEESKALKAQRRVFYNIQDLRDEGKVKVFETSHYLFEKELIDEARDDEDGGFIDFADEDEGKEIKFRASEVSFAGRKYKEFKSFSFEDREEPLSKEVLKQAISFDEIMEIPTYEEVEKIFYGVDEEDEKSEKKSKTVENDDEESEDDEVSKKSWFEKEIIDDIKKVENQWQKIIQTSINPKCNKAELLYKSEDILEKILMDLMDENISRIVVNSKEERDRINKLTKENKEYQNIPIEVQKKKDILEIYDIRKQQKKAQNRKVWLKCGGFITIDKTEALTAIDVNTGKFTGNNNDLQSTLLKVNK